MSRLRKVAVTCIAVTSAVWFISNAAQIRFQNSALGFGCDIDDGLIRIFSFNAPLLDRVEFRRNAPRWRGAAGCGFGELWWRPPASFSVFPGKGWAVALAAWPPLAASLLLGLYAWRSGRRGSYVYKINRSRAIIVSKWTGAWLCILLSAFGFATTFFDCTYTSGSRSYRVVNGIAIHYTHILTELQNNFVLVRMFPQGWNLVATSDSVWNKLNSSPLGLFWGIRDDSDPDGIGPPLVRSVAVVPLWVPVAALAAPTGLLVWLDRKRRVREGVCVGCGYLLTGNTSGRCPECGTPASVV